MVENEKESLHSPLGTSVLNDHYGHEEMGLFEMCV